MIDEIRGRVYWRRAIRAYHISLKEERSMLVVSRYIRHFFRGLLLCLVSFFLWVIFRDYDYLPYAFALGMVLGFAMVVFSFMYYLLDRTGRDLLKRAKESADRYNSEHCDEAPRDEIVKTWLSPLK